MGPSNAVEISTKYYLKGRYLAHSIDPMRGPMQGTLLCAGCMRNFDRDALEAL